MKTKDTTLYPEIGAQGDLVCTLSYGQSTYVCGEKTAPPAPFLFRDTITYDDGPKNSTLVLSNQHVISFPVYKRATHLETYTVPSVGGATCQYTYRNVGYRITPGTTCYSYVAGITSDPNSYLYGIDTTCAMTNAGMFGAISASVIRTVQDKILTDEALLGFKDTFNLLAFIGELRDVKQLPEMITKWSKTDKDISGKYLGYQFGVVPMYGDIPKIWDRLQNTSLSVDRWNRDAEDGVVHRERRTIPLPDSLLALPGWERAKDGSLLRDAKHNFTRVFTRTKKVPGPKYGVSSYYTLTHTVTQKIKPSVQLYFVPLTVPKDLFDDIKRSIWGINKPLSALWELVPFSFVVDWVTNVGDLIGEFERKAPILKMEVVAAGYSVSIETTVDTSIVQTFNVGTGVSCFVGSFKTTDKYYKRDILPRDKLFEFNKNYSLEFSPIGDKQQLLGTALLHQILR